MHAGEELPSLHIFTFCWRNIWNHHSFHHFFQEKYAIWKGFHVWWGAYSILLAFTRVGLVKRVRSYKTSSRVFEYAFRYFRQMSREAVDGRTINVCICTTKSRKLSLSKEPKMWHHTRRASSSCFPSWWYPISGSPVGKTPLTLKRRQCHQT